MRASIAALALTSILAVTMSLFSPPGTPAAGPAIALPAPALKGPISVEQALAQRRTQRSFAVRGLNLAQLGQLAWAAQGLTKPPRLKTAPSAGATYPLDLYTVVGEGAVEGLAAGVYHYRPEGHGLTLVQAGDKRRETAADALGQSWMAGAPIMLVITGHYQRCTDRYGQRGVAYTHMEAGHAGQNIFLQAEALGLKAGIVGAFRDEQVQRTLGLPAPHEPLLIMPVGYAP